MDPELEKLIPGFGLVGGKSEGSTTLPVTEVTTEAREEEVVETPTIEDEGETNTEVESEENETEVKPKTKSKVATENDGEESNSEKEEVSEEERTDDFAEDDELDKRLGKEKAKVKQDPNSKVPDKSKTLLPNKPVLIPRDLEGFEEDEKVLLGEMSNDAFNRFVPIIKEAKNFKQEKERLTQEIEIAKKTIPAKSYFNKLGYIEDEEFTTQQTQATTASAYSSFYREQRINMLTSGKCYNLAGLDQNGNPVAGQLVEARDEGEKIKYAAGIEDIIRQQEMVAQQASGKLEQIRTSWETKSSNALSMLAEKEKKYFPHFAAQGEKNEFVKAMADTLREEGFGENPLKNMMCYLYAALMESAKIANKKLEAHNKAVTAEQISKNTGPVTRTVTTVKPSANRNGAAKANNMATDDEFENRLRSR